MHNYNFVLQKNLTEIKLTMLKDVITIPHLHIQKTEVLKIWNPGWQHQHCLEKMQFRLIPAQSENLKGV